MVKDLPDEKMQLELLDKLNMSDNQKISVIRTMSDDIKFKLLSEKNDIGQSEIMSLIASMDLENFRKYFNDEKYKTFIDENEIDLCRLVRRMSSEKQIQFVEEIDKINFDVTEERCIKEIVASLENKQKETLKTNGKIANEYKKYLDMEVDFEGNIEANIDCDDLEIYRDLDRLLNINPINFDKVQQEKMEKLCAICPKIDIKDNIKLGASTPEEYFCGNKWINEVIEKINPEWSDIQKVAFIDNQIGKKISYAFDYESEVCDIGDVRALYRVISSGNGVCNGIAQIEEVMLKKLGIDCTRVASGVHSFVKLNNIEIPTKDGTKVGTTILDPTWNLAAQRFGAKPNNFCKSYEEIRKHDIRKDGSDSLAHKNDEDLADATFDMDEETLREIYHSIGLTKEDRDFPIKDLKDKSDEIYTNSSDLGDVVNKQFELLKDYSSDFYTCPSSTQNVLGDILLKPEKLGADRCIIDRVYSKEDENKKAVLYVYIKQGDAEKFYGLDEEKQDFLQFSKDEFESQYECYENDLKSLNGVRPWEKEVEIDEDLTKSSGHIEASKNKNKEVEVR